MARKPGRKQEFEGGARALDYWGKRVEAIIANKRDAKVLTFRPRM